MSANRKQTGRVSKVTPRMRYAPRAILSGTLGFAASFVVACGGGSGLLSGGQASTLSGQLDQISSAVAQKDCAGASGATVALARSIQRLPATINTTLRANLAQGVQAVSVLALRDCRQTTPPTTTSSSSTTTSSTTSSSTTSTPTSTSTTTSTPTQTSTSTTSPPTTSSSATTPTPPGTTSTGSGGAGLGGSTGGIAGTGKGNGNSNGNGNGNGGNAQ